MDIIIYNLIKMLSWAGLVFSVLSVFKPDWMITFMIKASHWKLKCLGFQADIRPMPNTRNVMRAWSVVMALIFGALVYVLTVVVTVAYVLK